ncbi:MAG: nucleoside diphosphate kinase regulator [Pseudoxanthomonas suwonensis]|nr:nucleoside diphosphate kinase regulator [Pseudoxanthomonas suwonensis]
MSTEPRPPLTLSRLDADRIESLLEKSPQNAATTSLAEELLRANVVEPKDVPPDVVSMHSTVLLRNETSGDEREVTLVYPHEAIGDGSKVSILAPVGSALLGLRTGDLIDWPMPGGHSAKLHVLAISFQPEASGQFHL